MSNTSATSGYLTPISQPAGEIQLQDVLHDMVVGVTGLPNKMVRPRWQPKPPKQPEHTVNWCAFGFADDEPENFSAVIHDSRGDGSDIVISWGTLNLLASFYGPSSWDLAGQLRAGLAIEQNRAPLRASGLALGEVGRRTRAAELVNNVWVQRVDLPLVLRNEARRTYGVLNLVDAPVTIGSDTGIVVQTIPMI